MAVSFATVASRVNAMLNAAATYTATPSDARFYTQQIKDAVNSADALVCNLILCNPTHPKRRGFLTSSTVANAAQIPARIGPIESVIIDGISARLRDKSEIARERTNALSLTTYRKGYWIDGSDLFFHNGTTATVWYCTFTKSTADPPVLQAPEEEEDAVFEAAMVNLCNPEGEDAEMLALHKALWEGHAARISAPQMGADWQMQGGSQ